MENRQLVAERIKLEAKKHGISVKHLLEECELGVNTVGKLAKGSRSGNRRESSNLSIRAIYKTIPEISAFV